MSRRGREDPKQKLIKRELETYFENEVVDERLLGVTWTGFDLSPDRRYLTIRFLPVPGTEDEAGEAMDALTPQVRERVSEILVRVPEVRFVLDRGADNQRRVEQILDELARQRKRDDA